MDLSNIVIILGAGAHVPYGFPTGKELKDTILKLNIDSKTISHKTEIADYRRNETKSNFLKQRICQLICDSDFLKEEYDLERGSNKYDLTVKAEVESFIDRFAKSHTSSIDYFISRPKASNADKFIGKALIGVVLGYHEENANVGYQESNWIQTIINNYIRDDYQSFFKKPPTIITFNYDRLFEYYLLTHLTRHHELSEEAGVGLIEGLKILHVYGSLGEFKKENITRFHHGLIKNIDIVRGQQDTEIEDSIFEKIYHSSKVYIFGFGYDSLNTKLLFKKISGFDDKDFHVNFISSSRKLSEVDKNRLRDLFPSSDCVKFYENEIDTIISEIDPFERKIKKFASSTIPL